MTIYKLSVCFSLLWTMSFAAVCSAQMSNSDTAPDVTTQSDSEATPTLRGTMAVPVQLQPSAAELDRSQGQEWHLATFRLEGSMCPACLLELEGKLKQFPGVVFVKIDRKNIPVAPVPVDRVSTRETATVDSTSVPSAAHKAETVIIYNNRLVEFDRLQHCIKLEKYKAIDLKDCLYQDSSRAQDSSK
jgi:hypothetical protein